MSEFDENELAIKAVNMILNNEWESCDQMLIKYKLMKKKKFIYFGF
jgi:hypothetical protein